MTKSNEPRDRVKSRCWQHSRREFLRDGPLIIGAGGALVTGYSSHAELFRQADNQCDLKASERPSKCIIIENGEFRLELAEDGVARSLKHKLSNDECLIRGVDMPVFHITLCEPLPGQLKLEYRAEPKTFACRSVRREGDRLIVAFDVVPHEITFRLTINESYVAFVVERVEYRVAAYRPEDSSEVTPIDSLHFLRLPVRDRDKFGEWLNVVWDEKTAVCVLATDPYCRIDFEKGRGYRVLDASTSDRVKTLGVGAALVTTRNGALLERIAKVEEDFGLPRGAKSRYCDEYNYSYYWAGKLKPENVDQHIEYAARGGFRMMMISHMDFAKTAGHFPWRSEYPNGIADLQEIVRKIKAKGMIPGLHIHYNKAHKEDSYVTPVPDHRLNLRRTFRLASVLDVEATDILVEENPIGCTLDDGRRILKVGSELVTYENYTTSPPYRFVGCTRGHLKTQRVRGEVGFILGLLDIDTWPMFVRFDQRTSIQREVASRLAEIQKIGFRFVYFDGAEDVNPPYWFNVSWAQLLVYEAMEPRLLLAEGAFRSHYSWHILSRGNAFDTFKPESMKAATRKYAAAEALRMAQDFTSGNFGWIGYWTPGEQTIGTQPDMLEYVTSRAAGWDSPISLWPSLEPLDAHPRTDDNLEVIRRWEEVRVHKWLSSVQKEALKNLEQEHILLVNEKGEFELVEYDQILAVDKNDRSIRAFVFARAGNAYVVYWHTSGEGTLEVPMQGKKLCLMDGLDKERLPIKRTDGGISIPAGKRRYLECPGISRDVVTRAFQKANVTNGRQVTMR